MERRSQVVATATLPRQRVKANCQQVEIPEEFPQAHLVLESRSQRSGDLRSVNVAARDAIGFSARPVHSLSALQQQ